MRSFIFTLAYLVPNERHTLVLSSDKVIGLMILADLHICGTEACRGRFQKSQKSFDYFEVSIRCPLRSWETKHLLYTLLFQHTTLIRVVNDVT